MRLLLENLNNLIRDIYLDLSGWHSLGALATLSSPQNAWQTILQTDDILASDSGAQSSRSISTERTSEMFYKSRKKLCELVRISYGWLLLKTCHFEA